MTARERSSRRWLNLRRIKSFRVAVPRGHTPIHSHQVTVRDVYVKEATVDEDWFINLTSILDALIAAI